MNGMENLIFGGYFPFTFRVSTLFKYGIYFHVKKVKYYNL